MRDVAVIDSTGTPAVDVPATVSFQMRWRSIGRVRRRGSGLAVAPGDPRAFLGRFFSAKAQGRFSGRSGTFTFASNLKPRGRTIFGVPGPEQNGALLPGAVQCDACGRPVVSPPASPW